MNNLTWFDYFVMGTDIRELIALLILDVFAIIVVLYTKKHGGIFY